MQFPVIFSTFFFSNIYDTSLSFNLEEETYLFVFAHIVEENMFQSNIKLNAYALSTCVEILMVE